MKSFLQKISVVTVLVASLHAVSAPSTIELLNVSYDPTREFYAEFNQAFAAHWWEKTQQKVRVRQSHGGSGKQARSVIDGLAADVVTLALAYDIDAISDITKKIPSDWQSKLPHNSSPYTSTIVFLVRKGNPKNVQDWDDLVKEGVRVITPNPKSSGGARWNYLAAWGYAVDTYGKEHAFDFVKRIFGNVVVLDSGARGATNTFVQRGLGDVLLAWENEALLSLHELGPDTFEIVVPSVSILAEPPVAVVTSNAQRHGTQEIASAYLDYLYTAQGQALAVKHYYRPRLPELVDEEALKIFPKSRLFTIDEMFGGWRQAQAEHFDDGGFFDNMYQP